MRFRVAFQVTKASASESVVLSREIRKLFAGEPALRERARISALTGGWTAGRSSRPCGTITAFVR